MKGDLMKVGAICRLSGLLAVLFLYAGLLKSENVTGLPLLDFRILNTTEGLPTSEVQKVYQDREGFMWFATRNGLCKYDGYRITVFRSDLPNSHHLSDNNIYCLADDNSGSLWIGTASGMSRFNKSSGLFEVIPIHNSTSKVVASILITGGN